MTSDAKVLAYLLRLKALIDQHLSEVEQAKAKPGCSARGEAETR